MSVFEYLGVLLSVVMGLGLTHVLIGISKTIHHRDTLRLYPVHTLWALNIMVYVIAVWWGMFWWSGQTEWTFFQFLFIILYAIVLFLLASLLSPWDISPDLDFAEHFYRTRRWFFGILVAAWIIDVPETLLKAQGDLRDLPSGYVFFIAAQVTLALTAAWTANRRFHAFYAAAWLVLMLGYLSFTTLANIAG